MPSAYVPPWLDYSPSVQAENMRTGIDAAERNADRSENRQESARDSMIKMSQMALEQKRSQAEMQQNQQQFQTDTTLKTAQLAIDKQEKDRQFALQQATQAQELALKKQQMDLQAQDAARRFQWQQNYQRRIGQLTSPASTTSADIAGADLSGAPAPTAGAGMDPTQASYQALSEVGPPPDESMAGFGASMRAMMPPKAPLPMQSGEDEAGKYRLYNGKLYPVPPPKPTPDTTDKDNMEREKMKASFIQNYVTKAASNPDEMGKPTKEVAKDALEAWNSAMEDEDEGGTKEAPTPSERSTKSPAASRYQIIQVQ